MNRISFDRRNGTAFIFVRRGPSEIEFRCYLEREFPKLELRVMPSLYQVDHAGRGIIVPLLERLLTVKAEPILVAPVRGSQYYQITARLDSPICYSGFLPENYMSDWHKSIRSRSIVDINYDCEDCVGELRPNGEKALVPFPANLQCIRDADGDYHVVRGE